MVLYERYRPRNHLNDLFWINLYGYSVCLAMQTMQICAIDSGIVNSSRFKTTFHGLTKPWIYGPMLCAIKSKLEFPIVRHLLEVLRMRSLYILNKTTYWLWHFWDDMTHILLSSWNGTSVVVCTQREHLSRRGPVRYDDEAITRQPRGGYLSDSPRSVE